MSEDDLVRRLQVGHDSGCAMSYGMHEHCCDCSYVDRQDAADAIVDLQARVAEAQAQAVAIAEQSARNKDRAERAESDLAAARAFRCEEERQLYQCRQRAELAEADLAAARADAETWHNTATGSGLRVIHLRNELAAARALRDEAIARVRDMYAGDDGQAWKEARKFLERIDALVGERKP